LISPVHGICLENTVIIPVPENSSSVLWTSLDREGHRPKIPCAVTERKVLKNTIDLLTESLTFYLVLFDIIFSEKEELEQWF
jgi:hypothetical protein